MCLIKAAAAADPEEANETHKERKNI